jgi:hypothetical protein
MCHSDLTDVDGPDLSDPDNRIFAYQKGEEIL